MPPVVMRLHATVLRATVLLVMLRRAIPQHVMHRHVTGRLEEQMTNLSWGDRW